MGITQAFAEDDLHWMQLAFQMALNAEGQQEVPIGAVLISGDKQLLGCGWNQMIQKHDPTAHAEIIAIREASQVSKNYRLLNSTLYVTLEPCCMCAGAIIAARIKRLVFATRDFKGGAAGSVCNLLKGAPLNHKVYIDEGIMAHECASLLQEFFKPRR